MTNQGAGSIEIYIGSRIEHDSERTTLDHVVHSLLAGSEQAVVLANLHIGGRQIDLVLALDYVTLLVEAKGYTRPVSGGVNGAWQVQVTSGRSKNVDNAYLQALSAKNALRDAMRTFAGSDVGYYPRAAVVFVPEIPPGSSVTEGDFKVSVIGLSALAEELQGGQLACWSLDQWRAFARHIGLYPVASPEAACDPALLRAEDLVSAYLAEYCGTYGPEADEMIDFACMSNGSEVSSNEIVRRVVERKDVLLIGPSGCGKSLLASGCGVAFAEHRGVPITVSAKDYEGSLKAIMDREVGLMSHCSAAELLVMARKLNLPALLIVDGYNECDENRRIALTRSVSAIGKRFEMGVLITSQLAPVRRDLLSVLHEVLVPATERKIKVAIASRALSGRLLSPAMEALIGTVGSGLEAGLVGEVGHEASIGVSRYGLFDAYVRKRLRESASEGIRALSLIAGWLSDRVALSLTVRDLDRLAQAERIPALLLTDLLDARLLRSRGDRWSLGHEQFFGAFAAESVIRRADGSAEAIISALRNPRHSDQKEFIVGAIDDDVLLTQVLEQISDSATVAACLSERCGHSAKDWAETQMTRVLSRMLDEAGRARFIVTGDTWWEASFDPERLSLWSGQDEAFVQCLPQLLIQGRYLSEVFSVVEALDRSIIAEIGRLHQQDPPKKNLRSSIFAISYGLGTSPGPAISRVCVTAHSSLFGNPEMSIIRELRRMHEEPLSWGQMYLVISLYRQFGGSAWQSSHASDVASFYTSVIADHWRTLPYHLRLAVVAAAGYCCGAEEPELSALVEAVESLLSNSDPIFNSMLFDVLQRLRPFSAEEQSHGEAVRDQLGRLLSNSEDEGACQEALSIYNCQFDHPYSNAYCEVVNALTDEQRRAFLKMAIKGARDDLFFLSLLIRDVTALDDPSINPVLMRWVALPKRDSVVPQDAIDVFVTTHVALGQLRGELPAGAMIAGDAAASSLQACGVILYWCNRKDVAEAERHRACRLAWEVLNQPDAGSALGAVKDCADIFTRWSNPDRTETSIVSRFPSEAAELCRQALARPDRQIRYFPHSFDRHPFGVLSFAIRVLELHGSVADLPLLRRFVDHAELGKAAISAVRAIGERRH